jgi:uncharacterized membrane protein YhaH (DUF805 family)
MALAIKCISIDALPDGLKILLQDACSPDTFLRRSLELSGVEAVDSFFCGIIAFFEGAYQEESLRLYTIDLLMNMTPITVIMLLEASRNGRSIMLSSVVVTLIGFAYQVFSGGVGLNIYWLFFLITGQAKRPGHRDRAYTEATFFACIVAYLFPTTAMFVMRDPEVTAIWQAFPLWMLLAQRFHLLVRPGNGQGSSRRTAQSLYALCFIVSAIAHLTIVWPIRDDNAALVAEFVPRIIGPSERVTLTDGVRNFLQWDGVFIALPALLTTLWFARTFKELLMIALWDVSASMAMGPGAALSAVYAWREEYVTPQ